MDINCVIGKDLLSKSPKVHSEKIVCGQNMLTNLSHADKSTLLIIVYSIYAVSNPLVQKHPLLLERVSVSEINLSHH